MSYCLTEITNKLRLLDLANKKGILGILPMPKDYLGVSEKFRVVFHLACFGMAFFLLLTAHTLAYKLVSVSKRNAKKEDHFKVFIIFLAVPLAFLYKMKIMSPFLISISTVLALLSIFLMIYKTLINVLSLFSHDFTYKRALTLKELLLIQIFSTVLLHVLFFFYPLSFIYKSSSLIYWIIEICSMHLIAKLKKRKR